MSEINKIKSLMADRKIGVTQLAKLLNQQQGKVANWFVRGGVPKKYLKEVASILGVTVDYILT